MKINTLFFGIAKDLVGKDQIHFDLDEKATIQNFEDLLKTHYADLKDIQNFTFAVNEVYVDRSYSLKENDVVALLPPVSGG